MLFALPPDAVISRGSPQLDVQIPPAVVAIVPAARSAEMPSAPVTGLIGLEAPFAQTQRT